jgi:hypothetical protein
MRARLERGNRDAYLEAWRQLLPQLNTGGRHAWLFREQSDPELFLEFVEAGDGTGSEHRDESSEWQTWLRSLAQYDGSATQRWEEVPLAATTTS